MYAIRNIKTGELMVQYGRTGNIQKPNEFSRTTGSSSYIVSLFPDETNARTQRTRVCRGTWIDKRNNVDYKSDEKDWEIVQVQVVPV